MLAGISYAAFWEMTPAEAYLEIKAHKARSDEHYGFLARVYAGLINVQGPKKPIKPEDLYTPQLSEAAPKPMSTEERTAEIERIREIARKNSPNRSPEA